MFRSFRIVALAAGVVTGIVSGSVATAPAEAQASRLFERLAGTWAGDGAVAVMGGAHERIRCRASYVPAGPTRLHLEITCASASFKLQIVSDIAREGDRLSGTWRETSFGAGGAVSGSVGADRISAVVDGGVMSARLSMTLHGNTQAVTLVSQSQLSGTASVSLRRE